ncbi:MAG: hypothetical protein Tsb0021_09430 [Chlamydiales bacterium]
MSKLPKWIPPMLATLYKKDPFDDEDWIFEKKFDGVRCLCFYDGKHVRLMSRNQNEVNHEYPEIAEEVVKLSDKSFVVDGEIVVEKGEMGSFSQMQNRIGVQKPTKELISKYRLTYYVFDLLFFDGEDLTNQPLEKRKHQLKQLNFSNRIHYTLHHNKNGTTFLKKMCQENYEGAIAKRKDSRYLSSRSKKWLKLKCQNRQELVIGGFTDPQGERKGFGALLVGFYEFCLCREGGYRLLG